MKSEMLDLALLRRMFKYLLPHLPLALWGLLLIIITTVAGSVSLFTLKPVFDGILSRPKEQIIEREETRTRGHALSYASEFAGATAHGAGKFLTRKTSFSELKKSGASRINRLLKTASIHDILFLSIFIVMLGVTIKTVCDYARKMVFLELNLRIMMRVRTQVYEKVMSFSMAFFNEYKVGDLLNRVVSETGIIQGLIVSTASNIAMNLIGALFFFTVMLFIDYKLTLLILFSFPPLLFLLDKVAYYLKRYQNKIQDLVGGILSVAQEAFNGIRLVIASNRQAHEVGRFRRTIDDFQRMTLKLSRVDFLAAPLSELFTTAVGAAVIAYALKTRVLNPHSDMTTGDFVVYMAFMLSMMKPIKVLNTHFVEFQKGMAVAKRVFDLLDRPADVQDLPGALPFTGLSQGIEIKNVSFSYRPGNPVIKNLSLSIKKGEVLALVGPSGGGKTTLVDLLARLYDPEQGQILIDGRDLKSYAVGTLRERLGVVTQDTVLFNESVAQNIAYGLPGASADEIKAAAEAANAHEFIIQLPQQYHTPIGERGTKLSGGQRQRLSIARAILRNPEILIFDEATSALDNESERKVQSAIDRLIENRTAVVVAHRLSTIRHANKIAVIDGGELKEFGAHNELIAQNGLYKRLYDLQFNYPKKGDNHVD